ncbi:hypothetical protein MHN79_07700 [Vibrio sp. Of14-4]|uniref:hypothetical protein n=1 Tax=Vibrio sp. Of14-4 TaxID=2724878 RepID=UPI001EF2BFDF|nr:hypothetical protein [Vibrio sp. Of14-4]MCG7489373.1 hypothetical protein [Vibrio sp. Of14-4]
MPTQVPVINTPSTSTPSKPETEVGNTPRLTSKDGGQGVKAVSSMPSNENSSASSKPLLTDAFVGAILTTTFTGAKLSTGSNVWLGQLATSALYVASVQWHDGKNLKGHIVSGIMAGHRNVRPDPGQREKQLEVF